MRTTVSFRVVIVFALICACAGIAEADRMEIDLSHSHWYVYRDVNANWENDTLHLPPVSVDSLEVNPPSEGWDSLNEKAETRVFLPATIEGEFWSETAEAYDGDGDYRGVSWWTTSVSIGTEYRGKRIFLDFASVYLRAEIFVNRQLVGYDVIGNTPFSVDISNAVLFGKRNEIAVRITDPCGNFDWNDRKAQKWGSYNLPASHGFGGITGPVTLRMVDRVYIKDVHILNKPEIDRVDIVAAIDNLMGFEVRGVLGVTLIPPKGSTAKTWSRKMKLKIDTKGTEITINAKPGKVLRWDLDNPNLYTAELRFEADDDAAVDTFRRQFGFRWFDIGKKKGDQRLYLNDKRIVLRGGMSWGFWPDNGVAPVGRLAEKDIKTAKELGLNYMNFHRAIGQPAALDAADRLGLLTYEEPGGWSLEGADPEDEFARKVRLRRLLRMVVRDRSRPSMIIYNLQNRTPNKFTESDWQAMHMVRHYDPSRILTFISGFWEEPPEESYERLFFKPYDDTEHYSGWYDMHNHTPTFGYSDQFYNGPHDYLRYTGKKNEIVFWGEDGGVYAPQRLELIKDAYQDKQPKGWMSKYYLDWYNSWNKFLETNGFDKYFPTVDDLTTSLGNVAMYYHGRIIENIRAGNTDDAYTINGWAATNIVNQGQVADMYRNPVGDPKILNYYNQPTYIAIKARNKIVRASGSAIFDFYLINEGNLKGTFDFDIIVRFQDESEIASQSMKGKVSGGEEYGQLLADNISCTMPLKHGYATCEAVLKDKDGNIKAYGFEKVFVINSSKGGIHANAAIIDESGEINKFLIRTFGSGLPRLTPDQENIYYIVIGKNDIQETSDLAPIMERVAGGATAIVLDGADRIAALLANGTVQDSDDLERLDIRKGNFIAGDHKLLSGLPEKTAFNWEYQVFYQPGRPRYGLIMPGVQTIVAAVSGSNGEVGTALTTIPFGEGEIILSTLDILPNLNKDIPSAYVAKHLFLNYLHYACQK